MVRWLVGVRTWVRVIPEAVIGVAVICKVLRSSVAVLLITCSLLATVVLPFSK